MHNSRIGKIIPAAIKKPLVKIINQTSSIPIRLHYACSHGKLYCPDKFFLYWNFKVMTGERLHLEKPKKFGEKLQWLKYYDHQFIYTQMVDKYAVRKLVEEKIGPDYLIPIYGVFKSFDEIDFSKLPNQFVMKCTHDSGSVKIIKDKSRMNYNELKSYFNERLQFNQYYLGREWPYKNVPHRIIIEEYLVDDSGYELRDYKVLCFHGEPKLIEYHTGRFEGHHTQDFYDVDWNLTDLEQKGLPSSKVQTTKPQQLEEMLRLSRILSENIPHIRVDWYIVKGKLLFSELTFFDSGGCVPFQKVEDEITLGGWISLPKKNR